MVLKLHGMAYSTCTKRVLTAAKEKGVAIELVPVDLSKGEHKTPAFLKLQPFGKIPVLEDTETGFTLFESRAIARYLDAKFKGQGTTLIPSDPKEAALVEQWLSVEAFNYDPYASGIVGQMVFSKWRGQEPDMEKVTSLKESWIKTLDTYEEHFKTTKNDYLTGKNFTIADLVHLPYTAMAVEQSGMGDLFTARPHLNAWWQRISSRPSWKAVNAPKNRRLVARASTNKLMPDAPLRGWRKYTAAFKHQPVSHIASFAILHEVTAILPLPMVYYALAASPLSDRLHELAFPESVMFEGNKRIRRLIELVGWKEEALGQDPARVMLDLTLSYAIVKATMPLRVGVCLLATPWFARVVVQPLSSWARKLGLKTLRSSQAPLQK